MYLEFLNLKKYKNKKEDDQLEIVCLFFLTKEMIVKKKKSKINKELAHRRSKSISNTGAVHQTSPNPTKHEGLFFFFPPPS